MLLSIVAILFPYTMYPLIIVLYWLLVGGVVGLLDKLKLLPRTRIFIGFLALGVIAGLWAARAWPEDVALMWNLPAVRLADLASEDGPKSYFLFSIFLWGFVGLVVQVLSNLMTKKTAS